MSHSSEHKTPLSYPEKYKFISHVNEEHQDELAMFAEAFTDLAIEATTPVNIKEVFVEGVELTIPNEDLSTDQCRFVKFDQPILIAEDLKAQYIALMQKAAKKLGKKTIKLQNQEFTVKDSYLVTPNMLRLVVTAPPATPLSHPGYAYLFDLTSPASATEQLAAADTESTRKQCYYTLRRAWQHEEGQNSPDAQSNTSQHQGEISAWIDVYLHGDTPGGNWARSLQSGDKITSLRDYPEKIEHLSNGQCLLIADETSLPTVARLLEVWQNPIAPIVFAITNDAEDSKYLENLELQEAMRQMDIRQRAIIIPILNSPDMDLTAHISERLAEDPDLAALTIDRVWGALEAADAKALRKRLKAELGLTRQDMVLKVYWRRQ
ncbi:siderophore-interacting protein [Psychrobacter pygoscelis]|uniref:siderophore-interacting protein n=1 Tax=Psychrobacter pygoscelis TaxID=2488563 RepID=UPI0010402DEE|nr:siderophore-interacting protein [Psychrobacter pygoscelis]